MKVYLIIGAVWGMFITSLFAGEISGADLLCPERKERLCEEKVRLHRLPDLVVSENSDGRQGVSAAYGGVSGDAIIVAGGCNFPEIPAAKGGPKIYYDQIYLLQNPESREAEWHKAGRLPVEVACGVSVTLSEGVVCIGGRNADRALNQVWLLKRSADGTSVRAEELAALPVAMDNMAGATDGKVIYVAGGNIDGTPGNRCFVLDGVNASVWKELPVFPGPSRLQPVGVVANHKFYLLGGFEPARDEQESIVSVDGLCYDPVCNRWSAVSEIRPEGERESRCLVGASGLSPDGEVVICQGGVDRSIFKAAGDNPVLLARAASMKQDTLISRLKREQTIYMNHEPEWYQFNRQLLIYHTTTDTWTSLGDFPELARAGAVMVFYKNNLVVVNGETKPGVRSTGASRIDLGYKKRIK